MPPKLIAAFVAFGMLSFSTSAPAQGMMSAGSPMLLNKNLVDIGRGRQLNMVCIGKGSPTVIFDQAWAGTTLDWQYVQEGVSALTRACFYDRAGEGYSDPSSRPGTPRNATDDLNALIRKAGIRGPVVLVGHSIGGLYATLYADRFFSDVAGLVLVDPGFSGQDDLSISGADKASVGRMQAQVLERMAACERFAREGQLSLKDPHNCFARGLPYYTQTEIDYVLPTFLRPGRWAALASQQGHLDEERPFARNWGSKPVIVLTRDKFPPIAGLSEATRSAYEERWKRGHADLAARSTRGRSVTVPKSGHYIQADQPRAVMDAIQEVVLDVRNTPVR